MKITDTLGLLSAPVGIVASILWGAKIASLLGLSIWLASAVVFLDVFIVLSVPYQFEESLATISLYKSGFGEFSGSHPIWPYMVLAIGNLAILGFIWLVWILVR